MTITKPINKKMKQLILSFALAILTFSCTNAQKTNFSKKALSEKLVTTNDEKVKFEEILKQNENKVVVIEIWASWCGDCVKAMPKIKELQNNNPDVNYVFISMDKTSEKWKSAIEKHDLKGSHYFAADGMKGDFGKAIDLDWIPRYIVIDKKGKIVLYRAIETDFDLINNTLKNIQ